MLLGALICLDVPCAKAAPAPTTEYRFSVPALPLRQALIQVALQAHLSISMPPQGLPATRTRPLIGTYTAEEALQHLLAASNFTFTFVDAGAVRITALSLARSRRRPVGNQTIIVTATKLAAPVDRLPYAIDVLTGAQLARQNMLSARDVASQLAGITVTDLGPGRDKILIRGMSDGPLTGNAQSTVGIYLDDVPITFNSPDPDLMLVDINRIEILRGPQGTLYGSGSIGGIYRIVTNQPDLSHYSGSLMIGGAMTAHGDPSGEIAGVANLPLVPDHIALRAVAYGQTRGGYIDDIRGPNNVNRLRRQGERISLKLTTGDVWSATLGFNQQTLNTKDSQYVVGGTSPLTRDVHMREPHDNDFTQGYIHIRGALSWADFTSTTSLLRHEIYSRYDASAALPFFSVTSYGPSPFEVGTTVRMLTEEMRLASHPDATVRWLAGLFVNSASAHHTGRLMVQSPAGVDTVAYSEDRRSRTSDFALFGALYLPLTPRLTFGAGLRWFLETQDVDSSVSQPPLASMRALEGTLSTQGLAPKFDLTFQASPSIMFYAQAAEGYRVGGFNTSGLVSQRLPTSPSGPQPYFRYGKDELWNYEIGAKLALFHERLHLRSAAFFDVWHNVQTEQLLPSGLPFTGNAGNAQNRGLELDASYDPFERLNLQASLFLNTPELTSANPTFPAPSDSNLLGVARFSGGLSVSYIQPLPHGLEAQFSGSVNYVGKSHFAFYDPTNRHMGNLLDAHLQASLRNDRWRLTAYVDNPADTVGNAFSYGNPFSLHTGLQTTPLRPRTIGLTVSRRF